jgi:hypothetical protein
MYTSRRLARPATAVLALAGLTGLTGLSTGSGEANAIPAAESCDQVQNPPAQLPRGIHEGDRLFATQYRGFLVQITCGRLELVEPTGWDACYFLYGDEVLRYPC